MRATSVSVKSYIPRMGTDSSIGAPNGYRPPCMSWWQGTGVAVAALVALLLVPCAAPAARYAGPTDQPGDREIVVRTGEERGDPVEFVSFEWIAKCRGGGAIRSRTDLTTFGRATPRGFGKRFSGRVADGRHTLKLRYSISGKKFDRSKFAGSFRLRARYVGPDKPREGTCRTNRVLWVARQFR